MQKTIFQFLVICCVIHACSISWYVFSLGHIQGRIIKAVSLINDRVTLNQGLLTEVQNRVFKGGHMGARINKARIKNRYICPKCGQLVKVDYVYPGGKSVMLTCNHIVKLDELKASK